MSEYQSASGALVWWPTVLSNGSRICPAQRPTLAGAPWTSRLLSNLTLPTRTFPKKSVVIRDHAGRVVRTIDGQNVAIANPQSSNYTYDPFGRLQHLSDNLNASTTFNYDAYGRLGDETDGDSGTTHYTYNAFGELATSLDQRGQQRTYAHDDLGRLKTINDAMGTATWIYDQGPSALGRLSETISPTGQQVFYDYAPNTATEHRGLLQSITNVIDGTAYVTSAHYDDLARVDYIDYPNTGSSPSIRANYCYDGLSGATYRLTEAIRNTRVSLTSARTSG